MSFKENLQKKEVEISEVFVFGSFAIIIWEILTQQKPFAGETPFLFNIKRILCFAVLIMNHSPLFFLDFLDLVFPSDSGVAIKKPRQRVCPWQKEMMVLEV